MIVNNQKRFTSNFTYFTSGESWNPIGKRTAWFTDIPFLRNPLLKYPSYRKPPGNINELNKDCFKTGSTIISINKVITLLIYNVIILDWFHCSLIYLMSSIYILSEVHQNNFSL
jgi:hypothetical protein